MKSIAVFCGSSFGINPAFKEQAYLLGQHLAQLNITLVYGGAHVGLMGAVADGTLESGGKVIGVLPHFLADRELAHKGLTEIIYVETMHDRKAKMMELAEGFIALPGGYGTLEELYEALTWKQLKLHNHPIGILNINGYYDKMLALHDHMTEQGLLRVINRDLLLVSDEATNLIQLMSS